MDFVIMRVTCNDNVDDDDDDGDDDGHNNVL